jgi:uncharacterized protein (DUF1778 family)
MNVGIKVGLDSARVQASQVVSDPLATEAERILAQQILDVLSNPTLSDEEMHERLMALKHASNANL